MKKSDLAWLAGLLEGEGSFVICTNTIRIMLSMTDEDVVIKAAKLMGATTVRFFVPPQAHYKRKYQTYIYADKAVALMTKLLPLMGARRQEQIQKALNHFAQHERKFRHKAPRVWSKQIVWRDHTIQ